MDTNQAAQWKAALEGQLQQASEDLTALTEAFSPLPDMFGNFDYWIDPQAQADYAGIFSQYVDAASSVATEVAKRLPVTLQTLHDTVEQFRLAAQEDEQQEAQ